MGWRRSGWWRGRLVEVAFAAGALFIACGRTEFVDGAEPAPSTPRSATPTKADSTSSYIDSPYQTGVSQGSASVAQIPATLHMTPASLSFIVDRAWAATGVSATLKITNGTTAPATLDAFEIQEVDGPLGGAAQFFSFEDAPTTVTLAPGETYRLTVVFQSQQVRPVAARLVVRSAQAPSGELEASLYGKVTSL